jgi:hypothetical protein
MDQYTNFRKVAEEISTNYVVTEKRKDELCKFTEARTKWPHNHKC